MKSNKTVIIGLVLVLLLGIGFTGYSFISNRCVADGTTVCYNKDDGVFRIEEGAKLMVQVENEELGQYLLETWNTLHPDHKDALLYTVKAPLTKTQLQEPFETDILVTHQNDAVYFLDRFFDLGGSVDQVIGSKIPSQLQDMINRRNYYFIPNSISGWVFVYNQTLMEELGYDIQDKDEDGLPDVFDNWEQIFAEADTIADKIGVSFPFTFMDQASFYPFLTGARWELYFTGNGSDPGFGKSEFYDGLEFIEAMSKVEIDKALPTSDVQEEIHEDETENSETDEQEETVDQPRVLAEDLPWQYQTVLTERRSLFTMLDKQVMQINNYQSTDGDTYVVAPFPKYKKHHLEPLGDVSGYAVSARTAYPSAAAEALRILRSGEGVSHYKSQEGKTLIYSHLHFADLKIEDPVVLNEIRAYNFHDTPSVLALNDNPSILSRSIYNEIDIMPPLRDLFDRKINRKEAQALIVEAANQWLENHKQGPEEKGDAGNGME